MKAGLAKLWHGFLYGIGFSIAWWLVFGALGYAVFDHLVADYFNAGKQPPAQQQTQQQSREAANQLKKQMDTLDMGRMQTTDPKAEPQ